MTDRLRAELSQMLEEHKAITSALNNLSDIANKEKEDRIYILCRRADFACTD